MKITETIKNSELASRRLKELSDSVMKQGKKVIATTLKRVVAIMKVYPSKRKGQKYVRTFRFRKSWKVAPTDNGFVISTSFPAAKYVVGNAYGKKQAWMHVSLDQGKRWNILREVVEEETKNLDKKILKEIRISGRRIGFN